MNRHLLEKVQIAGGFTPVDMATGANTGNWVSLKGYGRCSIVLFKGRGASAEPPTITLAQATEVAGTTSKSLTFTRIDQKTGTLSAIGVFTTTTQAAASTYALAAGNTEVIAVVDIKAEDLDIANGYDCLRCTIADVGTTSQIGGVLYLLHEPRYAATMANAVSPIAD